MSVWWVRSCRTIFSHLQSGCGVSACRTQPSQLSIPTFRPGQMGVLPEIVSIVTSGTASALASSLAVWLQNRRGDLKVRIRNGRRSIDVDARRLSSPDEALREVLAEAR